MQINRIGFEPNFQANFVRNNNMEKITDNILSNSDDEGKELVSELEQLAAHHKNALLLVDVVPERTIKGITLKPEYVMTNLKTNKSITVPLDEFDINTIKSLNNSSSKNYQTLFVNDEVKTNLNKLMSKYYVDEKLVYKKKTHSSK